MKKENELYNYDPANYCAIYARRSTNIDQDNIENQLQTSRDKAKTLNLLISDEYWDIESATRFEPLHRPGFKKLVYDMKNNKFKFLIVYKRDRLARKTIHFKEIKYLCEQNNVKLIYSSSDEVSLDDGSVASSLIENLLVAFSEMEPVNINARIQDGFNAKRANGLLTIGKRYAKGYQKYGEGKEAGLNQHTEVAPIFIDLFQRLSTIPLTKESIKSLAEDFKEKYKNINEKEEITFTTDYVIRTLKNPVYAGYMIRKSKTPIEKLIIKNNEGSLSIDKYNLLRAKNVPNPILSYEAWEHILINYFKNNTYSDIISSLSDKSILSGFFYCGKCKSRVYLIDNYFQCPSKCFKKPKESVLQLVSTEIINNLLTRDEIITYYDKKMGEVKAEINSIENSLNELINKQDKILLKMIKDKNIDNPKFYEITKEKESLKNEYDCLKEKMSEYNYYKENLYPLITNKEKNLLLQHFAINENITNDFLSKIIKKVSIDVHGKRAHIKSEFKSCNSIRESVTKKTR